MLNESIASDKRVIEFKTLYITNGHQTLSSKFPVEFANNIDELFPIT